MAAYYPITLRASPLLLLSFKEFINAIISYEFEVLNHAHMIKSAVALVESLYPVAGEITAIVTEPYNSFPQQLTLPFIVTILTAW